MPIELGDTMENIQLALGRLPSARQTLAYILYRIMQGAGARCNLHRRPGHRRRRAVRAFVDGAPWTGDPGTIELIDHRAIELQLDPGPEEPLTYTFPPEY